MLTTSRPDHLTEVGASALWSALLGTSSILFSWALACATPFPALATVAGAKMRIRDAIVLVGLSWLANQAVGYLVLGYPQTWDSFAWGATIGVAALVAIAPAYVLARHAQPVTVMLAGFGGAFLLYEAVLFVATAFLPSGPEAFAAAVVWQIFWINALALAALLLLHRAAVSIGITPRSVLPQPALSHG